LALPRGHYNITSRGTDVTGSGDRARLADFFYRSGFGINKGFDSVMGFRHAVPIAACEAPSRPRYTRHLEAASVMQDVATEALFVFAATPKQGGARDATPLRA
jgi:hypothetical protein